MTARTTHLDAGVRTAMITLSGAAKQGFGDPVLAELVQIRASQLNHCAFCLDMHVRNARESGADQRQLDLLDAWEEAEGVYTERERAALALTEAVTLLAVPDRAEARGGFVPDEVYEEAAKHFDDAALACLIGLITVINAWNRLMVSRRIPAGSTEW
ncbi:carboxymuconolactone decarboxylase family protein [Streptomyces sp. TS71-3]|uniref:carboxymuconolactone decarboxylase family protein n=1 Tax=Streptomyces sp. TS71-3 TaxID=2733862 RepID=UPI001B1986AA|nr:carboxymuconolactone decarboxylase family protein [Streptomyces sp. TS71-3]GHJ35109.1 alkyl hydroperoxide reductase AhpD [Streptomyces sp. TS71-3]